jgi:dipeptidyl aminopeptidase/acylaminoacyl peptidase
LKTGITNPFFEIILATTNIRDKRRRRRVVLSHLLTRFAFLAISAILLLSSLFAIQSNESVWASTFPGAKGQIAFVRGINSEPETYEIYVMNAHDGSGQTRLTDNSASDGDPSWSPDGTKIAFDSNRDSGNRDIYVMNAHDGSGQTRLTDEPDFDVFPTWSPDGTKIAFDSNKDSTKEGENNAIYFMNAHDGSDVTRLTDNSAFYSALDWGTNTSPPGSDGSTTTPSEQAIDEAISTIQNLDSVPQSVKTSIISLLGQVSNIVNHDIQITIDQAMARFLVP